LILFIDDEFPNNTSWRFVDAEFVFPNTNDPFATSFPEVYSINELDQDVQANFVAIKIGDLNCSASPNDFTGSSDDRNTGEDLIFNVKDQDLIAGSSYTIDFNINDIKDLRGYQFTLDFDHESLTFEQVTPGDLQGLNQNNFGLRFVERGAITTNWYSSEMLNAETTKGFSMTFTALKDAKLSDIININSRYTNAQAYFNDEFSDVAIEFESTTEVSTTFELFQNRPNPFKGQTTIGFSLPESNPGTLTIYDLSGREIKVIEGDFQKGYNEIDISSSILPGRGVFYYQLEVADHFATKKMVLLK